ncbi:MAG: nucleotidyltransferase family protein, partial [Pseudomonadota bacterium]
MTNELLLCRLLMARPDDLESFVRWCNAVADWEAFFRCAEEHRAKNLVSHYLRQCDAELKRCLPASIWRAVDRTLIRGLASAALLAKTLEEVLILASEAGIRVVVLKGLPLAERLYPAIGLRPSGDLDLLVARADVERLGSLLNRIGYHERDELG